MKRIILLTIILSSKFIIDIVSPLSNIAHSKAINYSIPCYTIEFISEDGRKLRNLTVTVYHVSQMFKLQKSILKNINKYEFNRFSSLPETACYIVAKKKGYKPVIFIGGRMHDNVPKFYKKNKYGILASTVINGKLNVYYKYKNGDVYNGEYDKDMPNGYGDKILKNGTWYKGLFKNGKFEDGVSFRKNKFKKYKNGIFVDYIKND